MNHVSDLKAFSSNSFIKGNYREIWSHTQVSPVFLLPKDVTTEFKSYHQRKQSSLRAREWRSKHSQDWIEAFEWLISMHWTIYIHLRLHMVAFVLICANDSIWENSKGTLRYSHPHYLWALHWQFSVMDTVLPFSSLTMFSCEEPLLSTVVLSSLIWPQNSSNVSVMMDQFWAFSSLLLCRTVFLRLC